MPPTYIILGGGVTGLTTSLQLHTLHPTSTIILIAKHLPGDSSPEYASPWAGANWLSTATDNGRQEYRDLITYNKFLELAERDKETGVHRMGIRAFYDSEIQEAGVLSQGTGKIWYEALTGLRMIGKEGLPRGVRFGYEASSFVIDVQVYLPWLQTEARKKGIQIRRANIDSLDDLVKRFPDASAYFNCTGLGALGLGGVEDKNVYPTRGQVMLVENPKVPLKTMYFRSPKRVHGDTTYVFPRGEHGGVVLGGCRLDNEWDGEVDMGFAEDIKRRCCDLARELGKPEDLRVIWHGVGLRPSRKGGARVEREKFGDALVIHNYGSGGTGYQASWGMAKEAVDLLQKDSRL